jgi:Heterokaryon incompatibility protein (HET)
MYGAASILPHVVRPSSEQKQESIWEPLARTIQDAITVVRELGETHLWTDVICIDQQDEEDFHAQIQKTHLIYEGALFTLVALNGRTADSGLPGVRENSRKEIGHSVRIEGSCFIGSPQIHFKEVIDRGCWRKRGWTFQEELLSRRFLFFGDHEVLLRCRISIGRETIDAMSLGGHSLRDNKYNPGSCVQSVWTFRSFQGSIKE